MSSLITKLSNHHKKGVSLQAELETQLEEGMTIAKVLLLNFVSEIEKTGSEIANYFDVTPAGAGGKVKALESVGLVKSHLTREDKRKRIVRITTRGAKLLAKLS